MARRLPEHLSTSDMKPSEFLAEAKALFGRWGQKWTRFMLHRPGLCGMNYCSLGALDRTEQGKHWGLRIKAERYLGKAIEERVGKRVSIHAFNDVGSSFFDFKSRTVAILYGVANFLPGVRLLRWLQVRKVWCRAIELALYDEAQQAGG